MVPLRCLQRYDQVVASRNRIVTQLSDSNRYVAHLESELAARSSDVSAAADALSQVGLDDSLVHATTR